MGAGRSGAEKIGFAAALGSFCDSHQELPSQSANLSRPDTLPSANFLSSRFGTDPKNFNSQRVSCFRRTLRINVAFGVAHAPWSAANDFMETVQVQPAGAVAPTLPASTVLSATPTGDDSFALTLGRALENMPNSVQDGSSIAPQASPREKRAAGNSFDSSSMAGIFLNCFVTNLIQPALTVALSTKAAESTVSLQSPAAETTADSLPNLDSGLNTSAGETSANTGTLSIAAAKGGVAVPGELSAWAGRGVGTTGTAKAEASKSTARARGQVANQFSGPVATTGQKQSEDTSAPQPVSVPAWVPGLHGTSPLSHPVEQQIGRAQSESNQVQSSSPRSAQESGPRQESQASPSFAYSWPQLEQVDHAQMQAAPASGSEASDSSTLFSATDHPALAESSSLLGTFAGADVQAASNPMVSLGQTDQFTPASGPEARDSSTPISATDHPALAEFFEPAGNVCGSRCAGCFQSYGFLGPNGPIHSCVRPGGEGFFHADLRNRSSGAGRILEPAGNVCGSRCAGCFQSHGFLGPNGPIHSCVRPGGEGFFHADLRNRSSGAGRILRACWERLREQMCRLLPTPRYPRAKWDKPRQRSPRWHAILPYASPEPIIRS